MNPIIPDDIKKAMDSILPPEALHGNVSVNTGTLDITASPITEAHMDRLELLFEQSVKELAKATGNEPENIHIVGVKLAFCMKQQSDEGSD